MLGWFRKARHSAEGVVGLAMTAEGVALAHVVWQDDTPVLQVCEFVRAIPAELLNTLRNRVAALRLQRLPAVILPAAADYQLLLVNRPEVPDDELRTAIRWQIRDQVSLAPEALVVDAFALPADAWRGRSPMVYCVAMARVRAQALVALAEAAGLQVQAIDIEEMAMRNLGLFSGHSEQNLALVKLNARDGLICVQHGDNLYMARRIECGVENRGENCAALSLEIQRSLDYFERQLGKGYVARLLLLPTPLAGDSLRAELDVLLSQPVQEVPCERLGGGSLLLHLPRAEQAVCLLATGAALRQEAD